MDETSLRIKQQELLDPRLLLGRDHAEIPPSQARGPEAIKAINIIPRYGGSIIHDCWASYLAYAHCGHGLCGAHLLRELTFVIETNNYRWAANIKRMLQQTCRRGDQENTLISD